MIRMTNVSVLSDGTVKMHCHVYDSRLLKPDFDLHFDPVSWKVLSSVDGLDMLYVNKAIFGFNIKRKENNLKEDMTYAWY